MTAPLVVAILCGFVLLMENLQARRERDKLRRVLIEVANSCAYACWREHGTEYNATGHELKCAHARNVIRAEIALGRRQPKEPEA